MSAPRRILCLLPFAPDPGADHGGGRVAGETVSRLAERHDVGVLHLAQGGDAVTGPHDLQVAFSGAVALPGRGRSLPGRALRATRARAGLVRGRPLWVTQSSVAEMRDRVRRVVAAWRPDVVQAEYVVMAQYLPSAGWGAARVLVDYDPAPESFADHAGTEGARWLDRADSRAWDRYQTRALARADAVVVFTARDRECALRRAPGTYVAVIPPGADPPRPSRTSSVPGRIVFVGNFRHPPNVDAARRLVEGIVPRVRARVPWAELVVVGPHAPGSLLRSAGEGTRFTGRVDEVTPLIESASVVALPISTGGGIRVKTLDALSCGAAVVASRRAIEGISVEDGIHVLVADADEDFADRITSLLADEAMRRGLGDRAARWARENLGWDVTMRRYDDLYRSLPTAR